MKIKKFENFNKDFFTKTTISSLMVYYQCDNCNAFWKMFNEKQVVKCPNCQSSDIQIISNEKWYNSLKKRIDKEQIPILDKDKDFEENELIDLISLGISKEKQKMRRNVN